VCSDNEDVLDKNAYAECIQPQTAALGMRFIDVVKITVTGRLS